MIRSSRCAIVAALLALGVAATAIGAIGSGTPSQATNDGAAADAGFSGSGGLWGDLPWGVAERPYISALSVVNGGVTTPVIVGGGPSAPRVRPGDLTAVVAPFNLCRRGEVAVEGRCYATPNRVGITIGQANGGGVGTDLGRPEVTPLQTVGPDTVIDMTVRLNSLGRTLRWTWLNGALEYWKASRLGQDDAEIRVRFRPVVTPAIDYGLFGANGCTATPIRDCAIPRSQGETLSANLVLSLDDSLPEALTGAVFATRGAVSGYLQPDGTASAPVLDLQIASAHLTAAGEVQTGELSALIPSQALLNLYGVQPADASSFFTARRSGDAGTQSAPRFTRWTAADEGTDGLLVTISDITFSAPTFAVARRAAAPLTAARRRGARTTVTAGAVRACRASACRASVLRIASRVGGRAVSVGTGSTTATGALNLSVPAARLGAGSRYTLVLRTKAGRLVTAGVGATR